MSSKYKRHFFVCTMQRPAGGKPSCAQRGSNDLYNALQESLGAHEDVWGEVSVTATGCLGPCFDGPTVVVYPEGCWYAGVKPEDADELVTRHMVGGEPVERLRYRWPED